MEHSWLANVPESLSPPLPGCHLLTAPFLQTATET
jgi:hypothetical protein